MSSSLSGVRLPSIHEMFPEHLLSPHSSGSPHQSKPIPHSPNATPILSLNTSLTQYSISENPGSPSTPTVNVRGSVQPRSTSKTGLSMLNSPRLSAGGTNATTTCLSRRDPSPSSITEEDDESDTPKKHVCNVCRKRFNRPSSLRIHINTHTGATPFRCPWPNCGREFNVNSNMRRHYRNHEPPASGINNAAGVHGPPALCSSLMEGVETTTPDLHGGRPPKRESLPSATSLHGVTHTSPYLSQHMGRQNVTDDTRPRSYSSSSSSSCSSVVLVDGLPPSHVSYDSDDDATGRNSTPLLRLAGPGSQRSQDSAGPRQAPSASFPPLSSSSARRRDWVPVVPSSPPAYPRERSINHHQLPVLSPRHQPYPSSR